MPSTTEIGDRFRDAMAVLLSAAGFQCTTEVLIESKKVDIVAKKFTQIEGAQTLLIETKCYTGNVDKDECISFGFEYGQLVDNKHGDRAWLISKTDISAAGKLLLTNDRRLACFTMAELQRRLFNVEGYLQELVAAYENDKVDDFYIQPHTKNNERLIDVVLQWIDDPASEPLAIIGGYGIGKSTFARAIAVHLARLALGSTIERIPLLVPLGEVFDNQAIDGLMGRVFASQYRIEGYFYRLFEVLNAAGQFVIIFDGFDEMKHGMTVARFERNVSELMKLDNGSSKILVLGRDTAFQTDVEFRSIIKGQKQTPRGQIVPSRGRRPLRPVAIREFTIEEAKQFVRTYFPIRFRELARGSDDDVEDVWIAGRLAELLDGSLDHLLVRPVHAQMMCEIATQRDLVVKGISKSKLYDLFIHYLIEREFQKKGRDPSFTIDTRRKFNAALAAWLWERGGASTTTFADIPDELCEGVTRDVHHDLDDVGLKREMIAGCLVDKGEETIYFSHRSLQEFLISEFIIENGIIDKIHMASEAPQADLQNLFSLLNPEIADFILERLHAERQIQDIVRAWMPKCRQLREFNLPIVCLYMLRQLAERGSYVLDLTASPWDYWILAAQKNRNDDFGIDTAGVEDSRYLLDRAFDVGGDVRLGAILHWLYAIQVDNGNSRKLLAVLISRMLLPSHMQFALQGVTSRRALTETEKERYLPLVALLRCSTFAREDVKKGFITVDIPSLIKTIMYSLGIGFSRIFEADETRTIRQIAFCSYSDVMREIGIGGTAPGALAAAAKFFDADDSRSKLAQYLSGDLSYGKSSQFFPRRQGTIRSKFSDPRS